MNTASNTRPRIVLKNKERLRLFQWLEGQGGKDTVQAKSDDDLAAAANLALGGGFQCTARHVADIRREFYGVRRWTRAGKPKPAAVDADCAALVARIEKLEHFGVTLGTSVSQVEQRIKTLEDRVIDAVRQVNSRADALEAMHAKIKTEFNL